MSDKLTREQEERSLQQTRLDLLEDDIGEFVQTCSDGFLCTKKELKTLVKQIRINLTLAMNFCLTHGYLDMEDGDEEVADER
jgi:hypothetical protein